MTPLPNQFPGRADQRGYQFTVLERADNVVLLEKHNPEHPWRRRYYEVIIVQETKQTHWPDGRVTEARETVPSSLNWGMHGWSYANLVDAQARFNSTIAAISPKPETRS